MSLVLSSWPLPSVPKLTLWFLGMVAILTLIIVIMSRIVNPLFAKIRKIIDRMVTVTRQQFQRDAGDSGLWTTV